MSASFEQRQSLYNEAEEPLARRAHVASGIRKRYEKFFDMSDLDDQAVLQKHYARFGGEMTPEKYAEALTESYAKDYVAPIPPKETFSEKASDVGEHAKEFAKMLVPFLVPEAPKVLGAVSKSAAVKAAVKGVATKIPGVSQIGFLAGHAINAAVDTKVAGDLQKTADTIPVPDLEAITQDYFGKLSPGLTAKGWSEQQIMDEARKRARNVVHGYEQTVGSIEEQVSEVQHMAAIGEPALAATDAFFLGVGAPAIEGLLTKGLQKIGLIKAPGASNAIGNVVKHAATGATIGSGGMAIHGGVDAGLSAAADLKTPEEIGHELVQGAFKGAKEGAKFGAALGGGIGAISEGIGAVARPAAKKAQRKAFIEDIARKEADDARLRGWQDRSEQQRVLARKTEQDVKDSIARTADSFDPHTNSIPLTGSSADDATTIIQQMHGENATLSEAGLRAATVIEEKLRLFNDANKEFGAIELPGKPAEGAAELRKPLGPLEQGGRPGAPAPEIAPRSLEAAPVAPIREGVEPLPREAPAPVEPVVEKPAAVAAAATPEQTIETALAPVKAGESSGYTFNPETFETDATPGFIVSVASKNVRNLNAEQVVKFREAMAPWLKKYKEEGKHASIGVFASEAKPGQFSIDLNVNVPTKEEALAIGRLTKQEAIAHIGPDGQWIENIPVTAAEKPVAPEKPAPEKPTPAQESAKSLARLKYADVVEVDGALHINRLGVEGGQGKPGKAGEVLDRILENADENQLPVTTRLTQVDGPKGGKIPLEKLIPWYEKRGFRVTDSTKLPEGQLATATLIRDPQPLPAREMGMLDANKAQFDKILADPKTPSDKGLAAPTRKPAPGQWHQTNLWADGNIVSARERIRAREAEFPEVDRRKAREAGFIGEKAGHRDPVSYDWADFADRVQIGANIMLKHGLEKAAWIEHMVKELGGSFRAIADRVYTESLSAYNARRPNGVDAVRTVVDDYVHRAGLGKGATSHTAYAPLDPKFSRRVASEYQKLKNAKEGSPEWKAAKKSYDALNQEIEAQYQAILDAGYKIEFTTKDPYPSSADMRADVAENKTIRAFKTPEENFHPFMTPAQNDKLRAVHDFFGHASEGYEFGPRGEDNAFRKHATTLSNTSVPALASETRGQNSWVNFWKDHEKLPPRERPFAEQKFGLLPEWTYKDVLTARGKRAKPNQLGVGFARRKPPEGVFEQAAVELSRGVRTIKEHDTMRSRFVSDGQETINEMMRVSPQSANWYHDDIAKMHDMVTEKIPEVGTPGGRALFDLLLAFTSPQKPVVDNFAIAFRLMQDFTKSGEVPLLQRFGQELNPQARTWVPRLNKLIKEHGGDLDALRAFLLEKNEKGVHTVEALFGPKVGPFTLNIQGIHDQITIDVWMVRRLRRLSGQMYTKEGGKKILNRDEAPLAHEQRIMVDGIRELKKQTGLDEDAIQAILWDNEKMVWERAGHMAPRITFSMAAEGVFKNLEKNAKAIEQDVKKPTQSSLNLE